MVGRNIARRTSGELPGLRDELFDHLDVEPALGRHAGHDADATNRHVGVLVGQQNCRAGRLVSPTGGIGAVDAGKHRDARLLELGMAIKRRAGAAPVAVELFLVRQLRAAAVDQPDQRNVQPARQVCRPQNVLGLPGQPGARHHFVVEPDDHRPSAGDLPKTVDDVRGPLLVLLRIVERMQRVPRAGVHQVLEPLIDGHPPPLVDPLGGKPGLLDICHRRGNTSLHRPQLSGAPGGPLHPARLQRRAEPLHRVEVRFH